MCLIKDAFVGKKKNSDFIKMHGTTIKIKKKMILILVPLSVLYTKLFINPRT